MSSETPKIQRIKKTKTVKGSLRAMFAILVSLPVLMVSIIGLTAVSGQTSELSSESSAALAYSQSYGVSALVGEYIAFLDAATGLDIIHDAITGAGTREQTRVVHGVPRREHSGDSQYSADK
jgi:hypothetical protein